jgi:hypothetical protein
MPLQDWNSGTKLFHTLPCWNDIACQLIGWRVTNLELGPTALNPAIPFFALDLDAGFFSGIRDRDLEDFEFFHDVYLSGGC